MSDLEISCRCGQFGAVVKDASPKTGSHVQCYCKDCQAGARVLGVEDTLMPRGGTDIFQTVPTGLEITRGQEHLAAFRLSPKGLMRWYASCCDTPVFNTLGHTKLSFIGILVDRCQGEDVDRTVGKVIAVNQTQAAQPGAGVLKDFGFNKAGWQIMKRHFATLLAGKSKVTPLFDQSGAPVVEPRVLTKEERKAATP